VEYYDGKSYLYPELEPRNINAEVNYINSCIGINAKPEELVALAEKMSLSARLSEDKREILVQVPPTRADILHQCDIMEDCAIAYNINRIVETTPKVNTVAAPLPINKLSDKLRREIAYCGYTEVLAFTLCSYAENFSFLNREDNGTAVTLANPKTVEYQVVRTSLFPGLLKTINANKHLPLPLKIFEVSDVVLRDESLERRARNQRNVGALWCGKVSGLEAIHGLVDRMMQVLGVKKGSKGYEIKESQNPTFFAGRQAELIFKGKVVGSFGIIHPEVLEKFEINFPCSALEFNLEEFL
jgi:phenylalanyl-tRNA synthetase beta chain